MSLRGFLTGGLGEHRISHLLQFWPVCILLPSANDIPRKSEGGQRLRGKGAASRRVPRDRVKGRPKLTTWREKFVSFRETECFCPRHPTFSMRGRTSADRGSSNVDSERRASHTNEGPARRCQGTPAVKGESREE